jgi:hypothetical protein
MKIFEKVGVQLHELLTFALGRGNHTIIVTIHILLRTDNQIKGL